jgi:hypothetical protein
MDLDTLIEQLTEIRDSHDADSIDIRIAYQPNWPLKATLHTVAHDRDRAEEEDEDGYSQVVWLVAGDVPYDENPYAHRALWDL